LGVVDFARPGGRNRRDLEIREVAVTGKVAKKPAAAAKDGALNRN
jgi:hypothetical protein